MLPSIGREISWSADAAPKVLASIVKVCDGLNELTRIVADDLEREDQVAVRKVIGAAMAMMITELKMPLEEKFPEIGS